MVSTFAGSGTIGSAEGTGTAAQFNNAQGITIDASGNIYVADTGNHKIRKITTAGLVSTFSGSGIAGHLNDFFTTSQFYLPGGLTLYGNTLYVTELGNHTVRAIDQTGSVSAVAGYPSYSGHSEGTGVYGRFNLPRGITSNASGDLYVADPGNNMIRKVVSNTVSNYAGSMAQGYENGNARSAQFQYPGSLVLDAAGNMYVADGNNNRIRKISPTGIVTTIAGTQAAGSTDGAAASAKFFSPSGIAIDPSGNLYIADTYNHKIRKITTAGIVSTIAGSGTTGNADGTGTAASFNSPYGIAIDASGNLYIADQGNHSIRKITSGGVVTTLAGTGSSGSANGTGNSASFNSPYGIAVDALGNCYVADTYNNKIRKVTADGVVTNFSNLSNHAPFGISMNADGSFFITNAGSHTIYKISTSGTATFIAGSAFNQGSDDGTGSAASFNTPTCVIKDASGNLLVADRDNSKIRKIILSPVTGILDEQTTTSTSMKLYPNPVQHRLNIETQHLGTCEVLNHIGETITHESIENNSIDVSSLQSGIYLLKVKTDKGYVVQKFIKE